jgi:FKBP-type peptidyl-prolyl cis-trans isomerase 2
VSYRIRNKKGDNMKKIFLKILILLVAGLLLFSGCIDQKTNSRQTGNQKIVKIGDNVSVDYIGTIDGNVVATSIESVAKENNLSQTNGQYGPIKFVVGSGKVIKGFDEGIIGMREGESKTLTMPPEKAFGVIDPRLIKIVPIIQTIPMTITSPRIVNVTTDQFESTFGTNHTTGDIVQIPNLNISATIKNMTATNVSISYNLAVGTQISDKPFKETVIKIDENNITTKFDVKKNDTVILPDAVWRSTVIDVNSENMTLRHNRIPDVVVPTTLGKMSIHFNDTDITMDLNNPFAGKTVIYNVTIVSID